MNLNFLRVGGNDQVIWNALGFVNGKFAVPIVSIPSVTYLRQCCRLLSLPVMMMMCEYGRADGSSLTEGYELVGGSGFFNRPAFQ